MPDDIRTRIAAVLRLHQWRATVRTSDNDPVLDCCCGIAFGGALDCQRGAFDSYREHVADAVIRELNLAIPCATTGCRMRQITRAASDLGATQ